MCSYRRARAVATENGDGTVCDFLTQTGTEGRQHLSPPHAKRQSYRVLSSDTSFFRKIYINYEKYPGFQPSVGHSVLAIQRGRRAHLPHPSAVPHVESSFECRDMQIFT